MPCRNYQIPPFDGIGANEYIVDVTHLVPGPDGKPVPAVDFMSMVDTPWPWELNMWYHTLNVGFRTRISGETDFPCIYGERVGLGRSYVKCGTMDLRGLVRRHPRRPQLCQRRVVISWISTSTTCASAKTAANCGSKRRPPCTSPPVLPRAWLRSRMTPSANGPSTKNPTGTSSGARSGATREVPVEVIVNGQPVATQKIVADGTLRDSLST